MKAPNVKKVEPGSMVYVIPGEPVHMIKSTNLNENEWTSQKQLMVNFMIYLEGQHKGELIRGPISLEVIFYLDPDHFTPSKEKPYHTNIVNLIRFIEHIGRNVIFTNQCSIIEIAAKKFYSKDNRTEIYIREVDR